MKDRRTCRLVGMPLERFYLWIASRELVRASNPPPGFPAVHAASNLDLVLGPLPIYLVSIYPPPPCGLDPVLAVRAALPAYLSRFFPFAGCVVRHPDTNVPEVACSNAGAELVVADAAGVRLAAVDFARFDGSLGMIQIPFDSGLALSLQVVRFACGGYSLTVGTNHFFADGRALIVLLNSLAEMVRTGGGLVS